MLVEDAAGLVPALGASRAAALVGHDWGGVIGWHVAARRPAVLERLIVLNAPHPAAFARELCTPGQLLRSWYALAFQLPWLPERLLRAGDFQLVRRALERSVRRLGALSPADWERHRAALAEPGALTAALHYYRAAARRLLHGRAGTVGRLPVIDAPTLLIWGEQDPALGVRLTEGLTPWVSRLAVRRLPSAGHWVHRDEPEVVTAALLDWLRVPVATTTR